MAPTVIGFTLLYSVIFYSNLFYSTLLYSTMLYFWHCRAYFLQTITVA